MDIEMTNNSEQIIQVLGDRIEEIERTLDEDEDFCNKDIDATYQAAVNYLKSFEEKFNEKLNELKIKLEKIREENIDVSKQNKKQFDDEIEIVNEIFSSGKHQEALEKLEDYKKRFEQRKTIIQIIPKLFMRPIDLQEYFSFDKPLTNSRLSSNDNHQYSRDQVTPIMKSQKPIATTPRHMDDHDNNNNEKEFNRPSKNFDTQRSLPNNYPINREVKSPLSTVPSRPLRISTRLLPSPTSPSLSASNSRGNLSSSHTPLRTTPSSPNIIQSYNPHQMLPVKTFKGADGLVSTYVTHFEHVRDTSVLMTCNEDYIIVGRSRSNQLLSWSLSAFSRVDGSEHHLNWNDQLITSIGVINKKIIYIFSGRHFIIYSMESLCKINSWVLSNDQSHQHSELKSQQCGIGTVYDNYIYYTSLNIKCQWILSIFELETIKHIYDFNLSENFSDVKRFIHVCVNDRYVSFLVETDGKQYAAAFCSRNQHSLMALKERTVLSYPGNPLTICSIYIYHLQKYVFFINDPSINIIHIVTNEKYIQSSTIVAHAFYYIPENQELLFVSNDGIYSINMNEQKNFFLKYN
ncbi:unnamed protein product [Rotaria socialis]